MITNHTLLQIGAFFNLPKLLKGRTKCVSYHDGNAALSTESPYFPKRVAARKIRALLDYEKSVYEGLDHIFAMSEYLKSSFVNDFGIAPQKITSIGAGINLPSLPEVDPHKDYDIKEILFIGVEFLRKGGPDVVEAFKKTRRKYPEAVLHIVGPKELDSSIKSAPNIKFHGFLSKNNQDDLQRLNALFARSTLLVMPSLYEPFGIAPLEAMAHSIPCIVSNRWALPELVTPGVNGELTEPSNSEMLAEKIIALFSDSQRMKRYGQAGRLMVKEKFTWDKVVGRLAQRLPHVCG